MSKLFAFVLGFCLLSCLGCPGERGQTTAQAPGGLTLDFDKSNSTNPLQVGNSVQLRLQLKEKPTGDYMLGAALIDSDSKQPTQWHAEPKDAVEFDPTTAKVRFLKKGKIKIWASYSKTSGQMESNALEFTIQ